MANVVFTRAARVDLKDIGRRIAQESGSLEIAARFLVTIESRCQLYATQPELAEACFTLGDGVRRFPVGGYVVFYRPDADGIQVVRVIHGRRDIPAAWRG